MGQQRGSRIRGPELTKKAGVEKKVRASLPSIYRTDQEKEKNEKKGVVGQARKRSNERLAIKERRGKTISSNAAE